MMGWLPQSSEIRKSGTDFIFRAVGFTRDAGNEAAFLLE
jgi:hypothetical protein